jgi:ABC-type maltose transport system permease subunit
LFGGIVRITIDIFRAMFGWVKNLHREAALDSMRNVLAVVGGATILADFATIKMWLILPMLAVAFLIWFLDYERHFRGQTVDES